MTTIDANDRPMTRRVIPPVIALLLMGAYVAAVIVELRQSANGEVLLRLNSAVITKDQRGSISDGSRFHLLHAGTNATVPFPRYHVADIDVTVTTVTYRVFGLDIKNIFKCNIATSNSSFGTDNERQLALTKMHRESLALAVPRSADASASHFTVVNNHESIISGPINMLSVVLLAAAPASAIAAAVIGIAMITTYRTPSQTDQY